MEQNMMEWFHKYSEKKEREVEGVKTRNQSDGSVSEVMRTNTN